MKNENAPLAVASSKAISSNETKDATCSDDAVPFSMAILAWTSGKGAANDILKDESLDILNDA